MNRKAEIEIIAIALLIIAELGVQEREPDDEMAIVPWARFDALADAFRRGGTDPNAPNLGKEAVLELLKEKEALKHCVDCGRPLDPEKGEVFLTDDGDVHCNDHYKEAWA